MIKSKSGKRYKTKQNQDFCSSVMGFRAVGAVILLALAVVLFPSGTPKAATQCNPGTNQVAFFVDSNFGGRCVIRDVGEYPTSSKIGLPNDSISSIKVGSNVQTLVCEHTFYEGRCELFAGNDSNLGNNTIGHDRISSVKVQSRGTPVTCTPGTGQAAFFEHSDFKGACTIRDIGSYPRSEDIGLANDIISSVKVGSNAQVFVCKDEFYEGKCELVTMDDSNLGNNVIGHDSILSAKVQRRGESTSCEPHRDQVAFFKDSNFMGACEVRGIGDYRDALKIGLRNDTMSSVKVGADVQAILCRDTDFKGDCQQFIQDFANLGNSRIGHDRVSSARVQVRGHEDCVPGQGQASLFMHSDFLAPCAVKDIGDYSSSPSIGVDNDSISSVRLGRGVQAVLCTDSSYKGDCQVFTNSVSNLGGTRIGHDTVSSARIQTLGFSECPPKDNEVAFFMHRDYVSPCVTKGPGEYKNSSEIGLNDESISSIKVGANAQACVCMNTNFEWSCKSITASDPNLTGNWNDSISSVKVQEAGAECSAAVTPTQGFSKLEINNCNDAKRTVYLWTRDITTNGSFVNRGSLASQWSNGSCPAGASPLEIPLVDKDNSNNNHKFQFVAVDPGAIDCGGRIDPTISACQKMTQQFLGDSNGLSVYLMVQ